MLKILVLLFFLKAYCTTRINLLPNVETPESIFLTDDLYNYLDTFPYLCLDDVRLCSNGFLLTITLLLYPLDSRLILLSSGGESTYSNGFYLRQLASDYLEFGVAINSSSYISKIPISSDIKETRLILIWNSTDLRVFVDGTYYERVTKPSPRNYISLNFDPVKNVKTILKQEATTQVLSALFYSNLTEALRIVRLPESTQETKLQLRNKINLFTSFNKSISYETGDTVDFLIRVQLKNIQTEVDFGDGEVKFKNGNGSVFHEYRTNGSKLIRFKAASIYNAEITDYQEERVIIGTRKRNETSKGIVFIELSSIGINGLNYKGKLSVASEVPYLCLVDYGDNSIKIRFSSRRKLDVFELERNYSFSGVYNVSVKCDASSQPRSLYDSLVIFLTNDSTIKTRRMFLSRTQSSFNVELPIRIVSPGIQLTLTEAQTPNSSINITNLTSRGNSLLSLRLNRTFTRGINNHLIVKSEDQVISTYIITYEEVIDEAPSVTLLTIPARQFELVQFLITISKLSSNMILNVNFGDDSFISFRITNESSFQISHVYRQLKDYRVDFTLANSISNKRTSINVTLEKSSRQFDFVVIDNASDIDEEVSFELVRLDLTKSIFVEWIRFYEDIKETKYELIQNDYTFELFDREPFRFAHRYSQYGFKNALLMIKNDFGISNLTCLVKIGTEVGTIHAILYDYFALVGNPVNLYVEIVKGNGYDVEIEFSSQSYTYVPWNDQNKKSFVAQKIYNQPGTYSIRVRVNNTFNRVTTTTCTKLTIYAPISKRSIPNCEFSFNTSYISLGHNTSISIVSDACDQEIKRNRLSFFWSFTRILPNEVLRQMNQFCLLQTDRNWLELARKSLDVDQYNLTAYVINREKPSIFKKIHQIFQVKSSPLIAKFVGSEDEQSLTFDENLIVNFFNQTYDPDNDDGVKSHLNFELVCLRAQDANLLESAVSRRDFEFERMGFYLIGSHKNIRFFDKNCLKFPELLRFERREPYEFVLNMSIFDLERNTNFLFKLFVHDNTRLAEATLKFKLLRLDLPSNDSNEMMRQFDKLDEMAFRNPQEALKFISAFSINVNQMNNEENNAEKLIELRGRIISILGKVSDRIEDPNSIKIVSNVLSSVTSDPDQIPLDFQDSASQIIQTMGQKFSLLNESQAEIIGFSLLSATDNIFNAAVNVVPIVENNFTSAEFLDEDNSTEPIRELPKKIAAPLEFYQNCEECEDFPEDRYKAKLEQEAEQNRLANEKRKKAALVGKQSKNGLSGVANAMANDSKIDQKGMSLTVSKGSQLKSNVIIVPASDEFGDETKKLIVSEKNPFQSVDSNSAVQGEIVTLELSNNNGDQILVNNSTSPFVIIIANNQDEPNTVNGSVTLTDFAYHKIYLATNDSALTINLIPKEIDDYYHVYISYSPNKKISEYPNERVYDFHFTIPLNSSENDNDKHKIFISNNETKGAGMYFVGIKLIRLSNMTKVQNEINSSISSQYQIQFYSSSCKYWSEVNNQWLTDGCFVGRKTTHKKTECLCYHLTTFGSDFYVPPNKIDFANVFSKFKNLNDNAGVFGTVIATFGAYILVAIWARWKDKKDLVKWHAAPLCDNLPTDKYFYLMSVQTGVGREAGCKSSVSFVLSGELHDSGVRKLSDGNKKGFDSGTVRNFLMSTSESLGSLTYLRIWHDNIGRRGVSSWYLNMISVVDLQSNKKYVFICDKWLAVEKDDGQIDRTLFAASPNDLSKFSHLFTSSVKKKFSDGHLWFSVFARPTKSHFTRLQRISCCLSLLFCTMIANAMFYQTSSNNKSEIQLGPLKFTLSQLYTSFISTLIVVPTNLLIVTIFRKAKNKPAVIMPNSKPYVAKHKYWRRIGDDIDNVKCAVNEKRKVIYKKNAHREAEDAENHRQGRILPHWTIYIGWSLCFLSSIVPAFFIILYSMEWGRDRSNEWLISILLSLVQSILIVDPVKVLVITAIITCILRKPDDESDTSLVDTSNPFYSAVANKDKDFIKISMSSFVNTDDLSEKMRSREVKLSHLQTIDPVELNRLRERRLKEIKLNGILQEMISYLTFLLILLFLCHQSKDPNTYLMHSEMTKAFLSNSLMPLEDIKSRPDFWSYIETVFLPELYAQEWYNGERLTWREKLMTKNRYSIRVGTPLIRQLRVKKASCKVPKAFKYLLTSCRADYNWIDDDTSDYDIGWLTLDTNKTATCNLKNSWCYQNTLKTKAVPMTGLFTTYKGGGYVASLGRTLNRSIESIQSLKENGWLDQQTRALLLEFTVYNPNVNLFASASFIVEYLSIGSAITYYNLKVFRLYNYVGSMAILLLVVQIVFILFLVFFTFREILKIKKQKKMYFGQIWNLNELLMILLAYVSIGMYAMKNTFATLAMKAIRESELGEFVNFNTIALWDDIFCSILALVAFLASLKFLKLLRFNKRIGMLSATLKYASGDLKSFSVACVFILLAYGIFGYSVFGQYIAGYRTLLTSIESVFLILLGQFSLDDLLSVNWILGVFFFTTFIFFVFVGMMTIFMAILEDSFGQVKEDLEKQENEYEFIEMLQEKMIKSVKKFKKLTKSLI